MYIYVNIYMYTFMYIYTTHEHITCASAACLSAAFCAADNKFWISRESCCPAKCWARHASSSASFSCKYEYVYKHPSYHAVCGSVLQCVEGWCSVLQCSKRTMPLALLASPINVNVYTIIRICIRCSGLQWVAVCCNSLSASCLDLC